MSIVRVSRGVGCSGTSACTWTTTDRQTGSFHSDAFLLCGSGHQDLEALKLSESVRPSWVWSPGLKPSWSADTSHHETTWTVGQNIFNNQWKKKISLLLQGCGGWLRISQMKRGLVQGSRVTTTPPTHRRTHTTNKLISNVSSEIATGKGRLASSVV